MRLNFASVICQKEVWRVLRQIFSIMVLIELMEFSLIPGQLEDRRISVNKPKMMIFRLMLKSSVRDLRTDSVVFRQRFSGLYLERFGLSIPDQLCQKLLA